MCIERIDKIEKCGIFRRPPKKEEILPPFKKDNLIYGWNYSGKTTLSRIFSMLEKKGIHEDYPELSLEIELSNGKRINEEDITNNNLNIRVFNKDYMTENLGEYPDPKFDAIYLAFDKNKKDKEEIDEIEEQISKIDDSIQNLEGKIKDKEKDKNEKEKGIDKSKQRTAKTVKEILSLMDFNIRHFGKHLRNDIEKELTAKELQEAIALYKGPQKDKFNLMPVNMNIEKGQAKEIKTAMESEIELEEIDDEIVNDAGKKNWAAKGLEFHNPGDKCSFCSNVVTKERIVKLKKIFEGAYDRSRRKVSGLIHELEDLTENIKSIKFPTKNDVLSPYQEKLSQLKLEEVRKEHIKKINSVIELLKEKKEEIERKKSTKSLREEYIFDISELENLLASNNGDIDAFESKKEEAKERIINHYASSFRKENKDTRNEIRYIEGTVKKQKEEKEKNKKEKNRKENRMRELNAQTSTLEHGLSELNDLIEQFLGHKEIVLEKESPDKKVFLLKRGDCPATSLSEGEKTIISFAYFYLKLESLPERQDSYNKMSETIVFIDDPISSLDHQHLSYMSSFLKDNVIGKCKQLFITTHNFEFFHSLRKFKRISEERIGNLFFIKTKSFDGERSAYLTKLPKTIKDFKTEYNYNFSLIHKFIHADANDSLDIYSIPNAVRIFIETYCGIHYPDGRSWKCSLSGFIKNETLEKEIHHFVHSGSHSRGADSTKPIMANPEISQKLIKKMFEAMRKNSKEHIKCLENSISEN